MALHLGKGIGEGDESGSLSAVVGDTESRAAEGLRVTVLGTVVAFLTVGSVDDTVTAVWLGAVSTAGVGGGVVVPGTLVALFQRVDDTITTGGELAVGSALVSSVSVEGTVIALLSCRSFQVSVSAFLSASGVASVASDMVRVITGLVGVNNTITAVGKDTVQSASILGTVGVVVSVVTTLVMVDDSVTACGFGAVGSASVGDVSVVASVVACLVRVLGCWTNRGWAESATALLLASGIAPPSSNNFIGNSVLVAGVTLLVVEDVNNTITTSAKLAVRSARSIRLVGVGSTVIALLTSLGETITTVGFTAVTASIVGSVEISIITIFVQISDTVTADWGGTVSTALGGVDSNREGVTTFTQVGGSITASWEFAVGSASARG